MQPISTPHHNQKFTDHELDKLLQDLNEFQGTSAPIQSSHGIISTFGDFVNGNPPLSLQCHLTQILHDFEEYETRTLPPSQTQSTTPPTNHLHYPPTLSFSPEIHDTQVMIDEMTGGTQDLIMDMDMDMDTDTGTDNFHDSTSALNMTTADHIILNTCCSSSYPSRTSATLGVDAFLTNLDTLSFQGTESFSMTTLGVTSIRYFHCKDNRNIWRRRRRKYKGVMETEEQTARRLEHTKIKNREAAAKAHQKKQAHEANLKFKLQRLRKKNRFLKNFLMFLEDDKKKRFSPMPLKRSVSGPV